ncbi:protein tyrosine phosphatase family protein [Alphaproteobacteria bacterium]|nr:protein tyrosine phosphatase family protein [Alphaproteobacteria bacterium]MDB2641401.1 protein tyrosine phosphatase family protein [Alphaproteobacteria bacterium]
MKLLNFHQITPRIGTAGHPKPEDLPAIAAAGYQVIINLAMHDADDAIAEEGSLVSKAGMSYFHLPVPWEAPTADHLKTFIGIMDALDDKQVLVHCQVNARVSAFMLKYLTFKGVSEANATTPLMQKWKPQMDDNWKAFLALTQEDVA